MHRVIHEDVGLTSGGRRWVFYYIFVLLDKHFKVARLHSDLKYFTKNVSNRVNCVLIINLCIIVVLVWPLSVQYLALSNYSALLRLICKTTNHVIQIQKNFVLFWRPNYCVTAMKQMPRVPQITHWKNYVYLLNHTLYLGRLNSQHKAPFLWF